MTVLRDGQHVETFETMEKVNHDVLVNRMVGRSIENVYDYSPRPHGEEALTVENLTGPGLHEAVSFTVANGEILGIFGLVGAGRSELMKLIYGAVPAETGSIKIHGKPVTIHRPSDAIKNGLMLCPEDRKKEGIIPIRSVMENLNIRRPPQERVFNQRKMGTPERQRESRSTHHQNPSLRQLILNLFRRQPAKSNPRALAL